MNKIRALVLILTLVACFMGVNAMNKKADEDKLKKEELLASSNSTQVEDLVIDNQGSEPTEEPTVTEDVVPTEEGKLHITSSYKTENVSQNTLKGNSNGIDFDKVKIPTVEVADVNSKEDPKTNNKPTPVKMPTKDPTPVVTSKVTPTPFVSGSKEGTLSPDGQYMIYTRKGIDVSSHNNKLKWDVGSGKDVPQPMDWNKVRASGVEFAIIRYGYRGYETGKLVKDACFEMNIEGALAAGLDVGVYVYSQAINETEALEEAAAICNAIKSYNITYPVFYDFEGAGENRVKNVSNKQLNKNARVFLDYVKAKGYTPGMYGCKYYMEDIWDMSKFEDCYIWVAHYGVKQTTYKGHYDMWQYSETGTVPGIDSALVDLNIEYIWKKVGEPAPGNNDKPEDPENPENPDVTPTVDPENPDATPTVDPENPGDVTGEPGENEPTPVVTPDDNPGGDPTVAPEDGPTETPEPSVTPEPVITPEVTEGPTPTPEEEAPAE